MGQCQVYSICAMKVISGKESEQRAGKKNVNKE